MSKKLRIVYATYEIPKNLGGMENLDSDIENIQEKVWRNMQF